MEKRRADIIENASSSHLTAKHESRQTHHSMFMTEDNPMPAAMVLFIDVWLFDIFHLVQSVVCDLFDIELKLLQVSIANTRRVHRIAEQRTIGWG